MEIVKLSSAAPIGNAPSHSADSVGYIDRLCNEVAAASCRCVVDRTHAIMPRQRGTYRCLDAI